MKVLHVVGGRLDEGAAKGAYILHENLLSAGIESTLLTNSLIENDYTGVNSVSDGFLGKTVSNLRMKLDNLHKLFYEDKSELKFSPGIFGYNIVKTKEYREADLVHLHWICNGFIDIRYFSSIKKPIVWTLRDMWPFTGGCHYSMDCEKYQEVCGSCPQLGSKKNKDLSTYLQKRKEQSYSENITFVGISEWITKQAEKSSLLSRSGIETISNNIDLKSFFPTEKQKAKKHFKLSLDKPVLLFGSQYLKSIYKGFDLLLEILKKIDIDVQILYFGRRNPEEFRDLNLNNHYLGFLNSDELRKAYTAADVFISPSRVESFGKTVAETMACGTPVVCFDNTGSADIVDHKVNGYLAMPFVSDDFISGIKYVLNHPDYEQLSKKSVEKARSFDAKIIVQKYIDLYSRVIEGYLTIYRSILGR